VDVVEVNEGVAIARALASIATTKTTQSLSAGVIIEGKGS